MKEKYKDSDCPWLYEEPTWQDRERQLDDDRAWWDKQIEKSKQRDYNEQQSYKEQQEQQSYKLALSSDFYQSKEYKMHCYRQFRDSFIGVIMDEQQEEILSKLKKEAGL
jgi:hypothetical protein